MRRDLDAPPAFSALPGGRFRDPLRRFAPAFPNSARAAGSALRTRAGHGRRSSALRHGSRRAGARRRRLNRHRRRRRSRRSRGGPPFGRADARGPLARTSRLRLAARRPAPCRMRVQSNSRSGLPASISRIASSSRGPRPTRTPGGVRNQYRIRVRPLPRRRDGWTTNVFSYPRLSLLNRSCGRAYFLFSTLCAVFFTAGRPGASSRRGRLRGRLGRGLPAFAFGLRGRLWRGLLASHLRRRGAVHQREPGLVADRVEAPQFGDVDVVLRREAARDLDAADGHIKVEGGRARPRCAHCAIASRWLTDSAVSTSTVPPASGLGRRWSARDRDRSGPDPIFTGHRLVAADVGGDVVFALQSDLEQPDDAVVLELFADRPDENRAHGASRENDVKHA